MVSEFRVAVLNWCVFFHEKRSQVTISDFGKDELIKRIHGEIKLCGSVMAPLVTIWAENAVIAQ